MPTSIDSSLNNHQFEESTGIPVQEVRPCSAGTETCLINQKKSMKVCYIKVFFFNALPCRMTAVYDRELLMVHCSLLGNQILID